MSCPVCQTVQEENVTVDMGVQSGSRLQMWYYKMDDGARIFDRVWDNEGFQCAVRNIPNLDPYSSRCYPVGLSSAIELYRTLSDCENSKMPGFLGVWGDGEYCYFGAKIYATRTPGPAPASNYPWIIRWHSDAECTETPAGALNDLKIRWTAYNSTENIMWSPDFFVPVVGTHILDTLP